MLITLEPCGPFGSNFLYLCILTCPATSMHNSGEALIKDLVGKALLMKMLITLEPCGMFGSNFIYNGDEASPSTILAG